MERNVKSLITRNAKSLGAISIAQTLVTGIYLYLRRAKYTKSFLESIRVDFTTFQNNYIFFVIFSQLGYTRMDIRRLFDQRLLEWRRREGNGFSWLRKHPEGQNIARVKLMQKQHKQEENASSFSIVSY